MVSNPSPCLLTVVLPQWPNRLGTLELPPTSQNRSHAKVPMVENTTTVLETAARLKWQVKSAGLVTRPLLGTSSLLLQPLNIKHGTVNQAFNCQTTTKVPLDGNTALVVAIASSGNSLQAGVQFPRLVIG